VTTRRRDTTLSDASIKGDEQMPDERPMPDAALDADAIPPAYVDEDEDDDPEED
jgi:hypothetical protein